jgi:hypothetical protein
MSLRQRIQLTTLSTLSTQKKGGSSGWLVGATPGRRRPTDDYSAEIVQLSGGGRRPPSIATARTFRHSQVWSPLNNY